MRKRICLGFHSPCTSRIFRKSQHTFAAEDPLNVTVREYPRKEELNHLKTQRFENHETIIWERILNGLDLNGLRPDLATYSSLLRWCGNLKALPNVKRVHAHIIQNGLEQNIILGRLLLQMYGNCWATADTLELFSRMDNRDPFSWNFVIISCAKSGQNEEAFRLFEQMQCEGLLPDKFVFASILSACSTAAVIARGKLMHVCIITSGFESDLVVATALVNMYGKCGILEDAHKTFDNMHDQDVVSWNAMIAVYAQHEQSKGAIELFGKMLGEGLMPNKVTFVSILSACANQAILTEGKKVHANIVAIGLDLDAITGTALVNMYGKCGSLLNARRIFDKVPKQDVVLWNAMIATYAQNGQGKEALQLFRQMKRERVAPAQATFVTVLDACASETTLIEGWQIHAVITDHGYEMDVVVGTALVNMYAKCGSLEDALIMFNKVPDRNVVLWNAMIAAYTLISHGEEALQLFKQMQCEGVIPDKVTFVCILCVCASHAALFECKRMHSHIASIGLESDLGLSVALVNMYGKRGNLEDARTLFERMPKCDAISWTALIAAYEQHGQCNDALLLVCQMQVEGVMPDKVTLVSIVSAFASQELLTEGICMHARIVGSGLDLDIDVHNALVSMYGKCGSLEHARTTFDRMSERSVVSWNAMLAIYAETEQGTEALQVYFQMYQEGVMPDKVTLVSILDSCANQAALAEGKRVHACIIGMCNGFESDVIVGTALVSIYGRCGNLEDAWGIFNKLNQQNEYSWTAMIDACARHGHGKAALQVFDKMQQEGIKPNRVTLLKLLSACSHAGLIEEAYHFFDLMNQNANNVPIVDHYNCMVDLLGRTGRLDEAEELINSMPLEPNVVTWSTLLGACRTKADVNRAEYAANRMLELDPQNAVPYVMLSNIYAAAGREDDAMILMNRMRDKGLKMARGPN